MEPYPIQFTVEDLGKGEDLMRELLLSFDTLVVCLCIYPISVHILLSIYVLSVTRPNKKCGFKMYLILI